MSLSPKSQDIFTLFIFPVFVFVCFCFIYPNLKLFQLFELVLVFSAMSCRVLVQTFTLPDIPESIYQLFKDSIYCITLTILLSALLCPCESYSYC